MGPLWKGSQDVLQQLEHIREHIKGAILKRFVGFTNKLATSCKNAVKNVYRVIENDCRTITGSNRRNAILECQCDSSTRIEKKDEIDARSQNYHIRTATDSDEYVKESANKNEKNFNERFLGL